MTIADSAQNQEALCGTYKYTLHVDVTPEAFTLDGRSLTYTPSNANHGTESLFTIRIENDYVRKDVVTHTMQWNSFCVSDDLTAVPEIQDLIIGGPILTPNTGESFYQYDIQDVAETLDLTATTQLNATLCGAYYYSESSDSQNSAFVITNNQLQIDPSKVQIPVGSISVSVEVSFYISNNQVNQESIGQRTFLFTDCSNEVQDVPALTSQTQIKKVGSSSASPISMSIYSDDTSWTNDPLCYPLTMSVRYKLSTDSDWITLSSSTSSGQLFPSLVVEPMSSYPYNKFGYQIEFSTDDLADVGLYEIQTVVENSKSQVFESPLSKFCIYRTELVSGQTFKTTPDASDDTGRPIFYIAS